MTAAVIRIDERRRCVTPAAQVAARGYRVAYRRGEVNHCPGCGRCSWHVGRVSAECAFCGTALPFATAAPGKDF